MASPKQLNGPLGPTYDATGQNPIAGYRGSMVAGSGITSGAGTLYRSVVTQEGGVIHTTIFVDLTGLKSGASAGDIIGKASAANCHLGQITTAVNGVLYRGQMACIEVPATGEPDIDLASGTVATGTQDAAASGLSGYVLNYDHAADYTAVGQSAVFTSVPVPNSYIYLVTSGGADTAVYTAGQVVIEFWGYDV